MTTPEALNELLTGLERELLDPAVRRDRARLHALLDAEFVEVGASGRVYTKAALVAHLSDDAPATVHADDFKVLALAPDAALVTYRTVRIGHDGTRGAPTLRCSLWRRTGQGWQMRYHQGTPAAA